MLYPAFPIHTFTCPRAAIHEHAGIPGIMQHAQYLAVLKLAPDYIPLAWTRMNAARKQYAGAAELSNRCHCRPGALKSTEQQADRTLNLLVWIQNHSAQRIIGQADGRPQE